MSTESNMSKQATIASWIAALAAVPKHAKLDAHCSYVGAPARRLDAKATEASTKSGATA